MSQLNTKKTLLAILLAASFSTQALADNVMGDIPVMPMNTERMPAAANPTDMTNSATATAVDQAILDAVAKSLPAKSVAALKAEVAAGNVDVYGRPLVNNATSPQVVTQAQPQANNYQTVNNSTGEHLSNPVPPLARPQVAGVDPLRDKVRKKYKAHQVVKIKPGHSELVPVATGLQNRISTKFRDVEVKTSDMEVPIDIDGGFI